MKVRAVSVECIEFFKNVIVVVEATTGTSIYYLVHCLNQFLFLVLFR